MAAVIGSLRVNIGANTASFEDGLKKAASTLTGFGKTAAAFATGDQLSKYIDKATDRFMDLVKATFHAIDSMEKINKESQKLGISTEALSSLAVVAKLSDVSLDELSKSVVKLSKGMADATKPTDANVRALNSLGISAKAFKALQPDKQLELLADAFKGAEDGAAKTAIAVALFGRAGAAMIPLLNHGSKAFRETKEEAEKFNLVIGSKAAKTAEDFNDNIKRLTLASQGWFNVLAGVLLPSLGKFAQDMVDSTKASDGFRESAERMGRAMLFVADNATVFAVAAGVVTLALFPMMRTLVVLTGTLYLLVKAFQAVAPEDVKEQWTRALGEMGFDTKALTMDIAKLTENINNASDVAKKRKLQWLDDEQVRIAQQFREKIHGITISALDLSGAFPGLGKGVAETAVQMKLVNAEFFLTGQALGVLPEKVSQLNNAMLGFRGAQITQENLLPWQQYNATMTELGLLLDKNKISVATFAIASAKAADTARNAFTTAAGGIAGSFSEMFTTIGGEHKGWAQAAKIAAAAQALINTFQGVSLALAQGGIFGFAAGAAILAKGLALVASIKGTPLGFAQGGSFRVPGAGGMDSQMVPIMATPGERVTVETPEQQRRGGGQTIINLHGTSFGFKDIRDAFEQLNNGMRDGHRFLVQRA